MMRWRGSFMTKLVPAQRACPDRFPHWVAPWHVAPACCSRCRLVSAPPVVWPWWWCVASCLMNPFHTLKTKVLLYICFKDSESVSPKELWLVTVRHKALSSGRNWKTKINAHSKWFCCWERCRKAKNYWSVDNTDLWLWQPHSRPCTRACGPPWGRTRRRCWAACCTWGRQSSPGGTRVPVLAAPPQ